AVPSGIGGRYVGSVTGESNTAGEYVLEIDGASGLSQAKVRGTIAGLNVGLLDASAAATDVYSFTLQAGQPATLAFKSARVQGTLQLQDGIGNVIASGTSGAPNVDLGIENSVAEESGTYCAVVMSETETESFAGAGYQNPSNFGASHSFTVTAETAGGHPT